jgi:hypothetical protein
MLLRCECVYEVCVCTLRTNHGELSLPEAPFQVAKLGKDALDVRVCVLGQGQIAICVKLRDGDSRLLLPDAPFLLPNWEKNPRSVCAAVRCICEVVRQ